MPVSEEAYDMAYATLPKYQANDGWVVHGKSGSGWLRSDNGKINENQPQGWFVGWAEKGKKSKMQNLACQVGLRLGRRFL